MLFVSLRDLQWRRRRFLIGVLATGLVFALTVVMSGVDASFHNEINRVVNVFDVDKWVVPADVSGPFTSTSVFPADEVKKVRARPGVERAEPVAFFRATVKTKNVKDLNLIGITEGGMVAPKVVEGHGVQRSGDLVTDKTLGLKLGEHVTLVGRQYTVVGRTSGLTYFAGTPAAFATIGDLQKGGFSGAPLATAIVVRGSTSSPPPGFRTLTNAEVKKDLGRPMESATSTISVITFLLWAIAAGIIGSVLYLQAIERTRDFAVFKATGVTSRTLLWGLAVQATALALCAALTALIVSLVLGPSFSIPVQVPTSTYIALPIVAVVDRSVRFAHRAAASRHRRPGVGIRMTVNLVNAELKVRDLVIEYSSGGYPVRPIDGLSLDASSGQLVLLLGASGCGKTTLLSVLAAILTPASGSVEVAGIEVTQLRGKALTQYRRQTVGVVFQAFNLVPSLTALENVMVPLRAAGVRRREARDRSLALLQQVDLEHRLHHRPADSPAVSNSASPSPARSRTTRRCCSPTSRPRTSTTSRSTAC